MEWQQIVGFYHVARLGSFTRAGEATLRTQSALSQQVKALEEEFGCRFFERVGTRRIRLTPSGERFLEFCESVLKGHEQVAEDLSVLKGVQKGPLKIAAPFTTLYHLIPGPLKEYLARFPHVEPTLLDRSQGSVARLVREGDVDFGFALESLAPKDLAAIRWKRVETVLMVPEGHPLGRLRRVTWKQMAKYPLILPPKEFQYDGRTMLEEQAEKLGLSCMIVMESSNVELTSVYVEMGLGVSLATVVRELPALSRRKLEFLSLDHYFKPDHVALLMRRDTERTPYKRAFVSAICGPEAWEADGVKR
ncbi:MAG: LysR family transcriptional regulator [Syntrophobacteraceae bacterium]